MNEKQQAERDRLLRLAEIEARLRALTEERKAELERSGPLPGKPVAKPIEPVARPVEPVAKPVEPAAKPVEPVAKPIEPVAKPIEMATVSPPAGHEGPRIEAAETVPPAATESLACASAVFVPTPAVPADPVADRRTETLADRNRDRRPGWKNTTPVRFARQTLGRVRTLPAALGALVGVLRSLPRAVGSRTARSPAAPEVASPEPELLIEVAARDRVADHLPAHELPAYQPPGQAPLAHEQVATEPEPIGRRRRRSRAVLAAAAVALVAIGGYAAFLIADLPIPLVSDGFLPAAETAGAGPAEADGDARAGTSDAVQTAALRPAGAVGLAATGSTVSTTAGSTGAAQGFGLDPAAEAWSPPALPEISDPETAEGGGGSVELELDLTAPEASRPDPVADLAPVQAGVKPERPAFISYEVAPRLLNAAEIQRLLERSYPAALRSAGIEGSVILRVFIDEEGVVQSTDVTESSGYPSMDEAALESTARMRFSPAMNRDKPIAVWLALPIQFR